MCLLLRACRCSKPLYNAKKVTTAWATSASCPRKKWSAPGTSVSALGSGQRVSRSWRAGSGQTGSRSPTTNNFGLGQVMRGEKSRRTTGGATPTMAVTRWSAAAARSPTPAPKEYPSTTTLGTGCQPTKWATAAATSAPSVSPPPCVPSLAPVPRKLNLSVATSCCHKALATADTTLLYMSPPCSGCGWQSTTPTSLPAVEVHMRPSKIRSPAGKVTFVSTRLLLCTDPPHVRLHGHSRDDATAPVRVQNVSCAPGSRHVQYPVQVV